MANDAKSPMATSSSAGMANAADPSGFYKKSMLLLQDAEVPFLVGGAYALHRVTKIERYTHDLDVFLRREHVESAIRAFRLAGYRADMVFTHWLAKAWSGEDAMDLIFRSGNGMSDVDDIWFERSQEATVLGVPVRLCPVEESIWVKAYIMERERYDGADIAHFLNATAERLDWKRLLDLFAEHWRLLLTHLVMFGFIYPSERRRIPDWVLRQLTLQLEVEQETPWTDGKLCNGTLLSRAQYLADIRQFGFSDGRLLPPGKMTPAEIEDWTAAIKPP